MTEAGLYFISNMGDTVKMDQPIALTNTDNIHDPDTKKWAEGWNEFAREYNAELEQKPAVVTNTKTIFSDDDGGLMFNPQTKTFGEANSTIEPLKNTDRTADGAGNTLEWDSMDKCWKGDSVPVANTETADDDLIFDPMMKKWL